MAAIQVLAPEVLLAGKQTKDKFGVEKVPVVLKPGVRVQAGEVCKHFDPAAFNPDHARYIARSEKAKPMAVNMYSAFWTLVLCVGVAVGVSLFTKPKPDAELTNLVMGLTPIPHEEKVPLIERPLLWATFVAVALVAINIIFW
jgi:solute:Na+ symporter, SSS family